MNVGRLLYGACEDHLPHIPSQSIDLVLCDMPYGTTRCKWDSVLDLTWLWTEYRRICRGAVVLFAQTPFDKVLGASNLRDLRYEWIWEKSSATGHFNAKRAPMKAHENILVFSAKAAPYYPIKTKGHIRKTATRGVDKSPVYNPGTAGTSYDSTERYPRSVLRFPSDKQRVSLHPTQKPVALCEYLISTHSQVGDVVLDNCMGSGTTGVACQNTDRVFIGVEKDAAYFAIAEKRLANG